MSTEWVTDSTQAIRNEYGPAPIPRTFGDMLDRFCTASWKLYQVQDQIHLAAKEERGLDAELTRKLVDLNLERNRLMTGLEAILMAAVTTGYVYVDTRTKLAHGLEEATDGQSLPG